MVVPSPPGAATPVGGLDGGRQRLRRRDRHRPGGGPHPPGACAWGETPSSSSTTPRRRPYAVNGSGRARGDLPRALHLPWPHHHAPQRPGPASVPGAGRLLDGAPALRPPLGAPLRAGHPLRRGRAGRLPACTAPSPAPEPSWGGSPPPAPSTSPLASPCRGQPLLPPPAYGRSLRLLAEGGAGRLLPGAHRRDGALLPGAGGLFSAEDFAAHRRRSTSPCAPPTAGWRCARRRLCRACWCWRC